MKMTCLYDVAHDSDKIIDKSIYRECYIRKYETLMI